jgi:predicted DNA-binding protein with PD1-like motif
VGGKVEYKLLHENSGQRTFAVVLSTGEEVVSSLNDFLKRENVHAAQLTKSASFPNSC